MKRTCGICCACPTLRTGSAVMEPCHICGELTRNLVRCTIHTEAPWNPLGPVVGADMEPSFHKRLRTFGPVDTDATRIASPEALYRYLHWLKRAKLSEVALRDEFHKFITNPTVGLMCEGISRFMFIRAAYWSNDVGPLIQVLERTIRNKDATLP